MDGSDLILEQKEFYNLNLETIKSEGEFLIELIKLSHLGIERKDKTSEFHDRATILLEYVQRTEDPNLALLLLNTLDKFRIYTKFYLTDNATNVKQLCNLIFIQFNLSKVEIFYKTMRLLNYYEGSIGKSNVTAILKKRINKMDANIYECFDLDLLLELFHTYIILDDYVAMKNLFLDLMMDWKYIDPVNNEKAFEKLLWYSFLLGIDKIFQENVSQYNKLVNSDRWGIKLHQYIIKRLSGNKPLESEKTPSLIKRFKKLDDYSVIEKEKISEKILSELENIANESFKWPSTDLNGSGIEETADSIGLNEKSELRKRGYQITDTTREQQWKVLQRAVGEIGLKKVAYTIAGNVKLRKGQKEGLNKFSYAISEWEYDLARLKKAFYKQEFKWPKT